MLTVLLALKSKKLTDNDLLGLKLKIARNLLSRNIDPNKIRALMAFLKLYVNFADPKTSIKLEEKISVMTKTENKEPFGIEERVLEYFKQEAMEKGMKEGVKEGIQQGKSEFVKYLISKMGMDNLQVASTDVEANVPITFVKKIRQELKKNFKK